MAKTRTISGIPSGWAREKVSFLKNRDVFMWPKAKTLYKGVTHKY